MIRKITVFVFGVALFVLPRITSAQTSSGSLQNFSSETRILSGVILSSQNELVAGVTVTARFRSGEQTAVSDREGAFRIALAKS